MRRGMTINPSRIRVDEDRIGESIEQMLRRMHKENEPIQATARMHYFERKDGVRPENDIRTDRFEVARSAMDKVNASTYAERMHTDGYIQNSQGEWIQPPTEPTGEA